MRIESNLKTSERLLELLKKAEHHKMTPEEIHEQRISFAFGNANIENPLVTREMVRKLADELYGKK